MVESGRAECVGHSRQFVLKKILTQFAVMTVIDPYMVLIIIMVELQSSCLPDLVPRFATRVPEGGDVERVVLDVIDHLVQPADNDAPIGLLAVGEQRVELPHRRHPG